MSCPRLRSRSLRPRWSRSGRIGAKGTDHGVLVIVSLDPRKYRIEVGYGLEGILPDGKVGDIGREMQPYLHTNDYNQAISLGVREISQVIATDAGVTLAGLEGNGAPVRERYTSQPQAQMQVNPIAALVFGVIVLVAIAVLIRTGHIGLLFFLLFNLMGGGGGGGFGGGDGEGGGGWRRRIWRIRRRRFRGWGREWKFLGQGTGNREQGTGKERAIA